MSLSVNFNASALNAHRNLRPGPRGRCRGPSSDSPVACGSTPPRTIRPVSSSPSRCGLQSAGLNQAIANSNDGINLVKTAEAALSEVHSLLRNMRTLAVHAANAGVNDANDIAADQQALDDAVASIDRISGQTRFNGKQLLDGSFTNQTFQVGANSTDTESISIGGVDSSTLGVDSLDLSGDAAGGIDAIDTAISTVSTTRSTLGSFQRNTLESPSAP